MLPFLYKSSNLWNETNSILSTCQKSIRYILELDPSSQIDKKIHTLPSISIKNSQKFKTYQNYSKG